MKIMIQRETLLEPLQLIAGVVEKRQTLPILSTVLMSVRSEQVLLTGTNLEVEMIGRIFLDANQVLAIGEIAVPAHKLTDICRLLPEKAILEISYEAGSQLKIKSGRSRFALSVFPAEDFPEVDEGTEFTDFSVPQNQLKKLIERTCFAMAEQDVRYFLNGLQIQIGRTGIYSVAADGHRLAFGALLNPIEIEPVHAIIPRKGVLELLRLLNDTKNEVLLGVSSRHLRVVTECYTFTSKLIDSVFVNYNELIPENCDKSFIIDRDNLKQAITRIAVLSTEKIRGIRFQLSQNTLKILASNMNQEHGEEEFTIDYQKPDMEIAFSASYLLDALSAIRSNTVELIFASSEQGFLVKEPNQDAFMYVIMPII
jgi:DNA polymerase III subunit beta